MSDILLSDFFIEILRKTPQHTRRNSSHTALPGNLLSCLLSCAAGLTKAPSTLIRFRLKTLILYTFSPIVHTNTMENGYLDPCKRRLSKTNFKVETCKNGFLSYQCGQAKTPKTNVFENADVMNSIISRHRRTKSMFSHNQCGWSTTIRKRQCGRGYLYPFPLNKKWRHTKTDQCGRSLIEIGQLISLTQLTIQSVSLDVLLL